MERNIRWNNYNFQVSFMFYKDQKMCCYKTGSQLIEIKKKLLKIRQTDGV